MRIRLALVALSLVTLGVACGDAAPSNSLAGRRGVPQPGDQTGHDDGDSEGENDTDPGNPNANTPPPSPNSAGDASNLFSLGLSTATPAADLGGKIEITVTVTQKDAAFTGAVNLEATGLPAGATGTWAPASVTVGSAPVTSKLTVNVGYNAIPSAAGTGTPIVIKATSGSGTSTANANFKVNPKMTLTIPMNIDALRQAGVGTQYLDQWGSAFGKTPSPLQTQAGNGIVVLVYNADSAPHVVHGNNGFAHGDSGNPIPAMSMEMQNGAPRQRTLNVGANVNGYMHEGANGSSVSFRMTVQAAP